jgi:hypothetical protein
MIPGRGGLFEAESEDLYLGLTLLERTMARQRSSMRWLHKGDANTNFFQLHVNQRRQRNHIGTSEVEGATLVEE